MKIGRITPTGTITEFPLPSPDGQPRAIAAGPDGNIWFGMDNGDIGRITPTGAVTTCTTGIAGDIGGLTAGPDESMWFTEYYEGRIGKITATGTGLAPNAPAGPRRSQRLRFRPAEAAEAVLPRFRPRHKRNPSSARSTSRRRRSTARPSA